MGKDVIRAVVADDDVFALPEHNRYPPIISRATRAGNDVTLTAR